MNVPASTIRIDDATPAEVRERLMVALALAGGETQVVLDGYLRLAVDTLEVLLTLAAAYRGQIRVRGAGAAVSRALALADVSAALVVDGGRPIAGDRPFVITFPSSGSICLRLGREAGSHRLLADAISHDWLRGLLADRLRIDLGELTHINSLLIAWLIQVSQAIAPGRVELANVHVQAATQLGQLRLTHLLPIVTG